MPWFWGSNSGKDDPTKSLDPDLKEFLDEQRPRPYTTAEQPSKPQEESNKDVIFPKLELPDSNKTYDDRPLPKESLFQDGRYKDLWKTYIPQTQIVAATSTPVERVISARKDRGSAIHHAALENCAYEEQLQQDCLNGVGRSGKIYSRVTMCKDETKSYNRCYQLQAKFMQALGYMSSFDTTDEQEERIQMHADKLYHRMMDYEEELDDAKRKGKPLPPLTSLFNNHRPVPSVEEIKLPQAMEAKLQTPLHELPPHERELAAKVALQEARVRNFNAEELFKLTTTMNEDRQRRQSWAVRTFGEVIGKFMIPDPPKQDGQMRPYTTEELDREVWRGTGVTNSATIPTTDAGKG